MIHLRIVLVLLLVGLTLHIATSFLLSHSVTTTIRTQHVDRTTKQQLYFTTSPLSSWSTSLSSTTRLYIQRGTPGRSAPRGKNDKSKRQYRVGELVRTELASILHSGLIKGKDASYLDDDLRSRISIVTVDVSPDLRQARVSVSIRGGKKRKDSSSDEGETTANVSSNDSIVDKRRAYSWLVDNTKAIRHTLAQRMSHLKTSPNLTFVQVDVAAAVDVMYLIDKVSKGYEREQIGEFGGDDDNLPNGFLADDDEDDDDDWEEEDEEFFNF